MTTLHLLRHGQIPTSSPRRFIGRTDLTLTDTGRLQMRRLGAHLQPYPIQRIVTSPLCRCQESAEILAQALDCQVETCPDLAEIDLGAWEGLSVEEIRHRFPGGYEQRGRDIAGYRPPAGESFTDLLHRVLPIFTAITATGKETAIMSHAGVNRVLLCHLLGMPLQELFNLPQEYGCYTTIIGEENQFVVGDINKTP